MTGRVFQERPPAEVFGMPLDLVTMDETVAACVQLVEGGRSAHHVVLNAGKVVLASRDGRLREIVREAHIVNADGQSVVWAGRFLGFDVPERVTGIDLMYRLLSEAASRGWPVFFLGARQDVLTSAVDRLRTDNPGLAVAGMHHGYFTDAAPVLEAIRNSGARILFIAMPSPAKEYFVAKHSTDLEGVFAMGVGGSLDVVAGRVSRAPEWVRRAGFEWLCRLIQEPGRMWRRYLVGNTVFVWLTLKEKLRRR